MASISFTYVGIVKWGKMSSSIELMPIGPKSGPYVDLEKELEEEFRREGAYFNHVDAFAEQTITTVAITIGTGVALHLIIKFLEKMLDIRKKESNPKTEISVRLQVNNNCYVLPSEKEKLLEDCRCTLKESDGDKE